MTEHDDDDWLAALLARNAVFRRGVTPARLPVARTPGQHALVTCMDPRVNLAALGVPGFDADGGSHSGVRVIRTIGGIAEERSLIVGIHLAGIREIAVVTHTDCGNALAKQRIAHIAAGVRACTGHADEQTLARELRVFDDPYQAVREEVARVRTLPFVPPEVVVHGLVYELADARLVAVVDGRAERLRGGGRGGERHGASSSPDVPDDSRRAAAQERRGGSDVGVEDSDRR